MLKFERKQKNYMEYAIDKDIITRQRTNPKIWDYSYLLLKNNLKVFLKFRELVVYENKERILDVGCGWKPWKKLFAGKNIEYVGVDLDPNVSPDIIASADKLPFPENYFDALIYSEVLEHSFQSNEVLNELIRVAKNGALVFISTPFIFPIHGYPHDFYRFTKYFYEKIFENHDILTLKASNSIFCIVFAIPNLVLENILPHSKVFLIIRFVFYSFFNVLALIMETILSLTLKILPLKFREKFKIKTSLMPLGYSGIIRIKK
jgi:2-polyprenyl-3-methyl-5-hydroxy-6-metoxy-1,4-benzoquinol methylase